MTRLLADVPTPSSGLQVQDLSAEAAQTGLSGRRVSDPTSCCLPQVLTSLQKQLRGERRRAVAAEEALSEFQAQQGAWGALLQQLLRDVQQQQHQQLEDPVLEVTGAEGQAGQV